MKQKRNRPSLGEGQAVSADENGGLGIRAFSKAHYKPVHHHSQDSILRADGKEIGEVTSDGTFQKHLRSTRHFLRMPPAIAFDVSTLEDAERAGARLVIVIDDDTGDEYRAPMALIWGRGFRLDRGWGDQIGLPLEYWSLNGGPDSVQPSFFAEAAR